MVKRLPTMRETGVQSLGGEDLLEKEMATHSSILAWEIPRTEEPGRASVHMVAKSQSRLSVYLNNRQQSLHCVPHLASENPRARASCEFHQR